MRRIIGLGFAFGMIGAGALSCSAMNDEGQENVETTHGELRKGTPGAMNGDPDYCNDPANPCVSGEGDCDNHTQCTGGTVCGLNNAPKFGFPLGDDVCVPPHCQNKVQDGNETSIDCGGSCGTVCQIQCTTPPLPASGAAGHCTTDCRCAAGDGDCNVDGECQNGLVCLQNQGSQFGFSAGTDVCIGAHCLNGVQDGDETGLNCGGSCAQCSGGGLSAQSYGGSSSDYGKAIAVDASGNIYVAGRFYASANFGGANLNSAGASDIWVAKYSSTGAHLWSRRFGAAFAEGDYQVSLAVDAAGSVIVGGNFYLSVSFGGGPLTAVDNADAFLFKLSSAGAHIWSKAFGGTGIDRVDGVTVDPNNNVLVTGSFQNSINLGGATLTSASTDTYDVFVAKFSSTGAHTWSQRYGGTGIDQGYGIAADAGGSAYVAGSYRDTVDFGTGAVTSNGTDDAFLIKLTSAGTTSWTRSFGGVSDDKALAVGVDVSRRPTVVGRYKLTVDFGAGASTVVGGTDVFAVAFDSEGAFRWAKTFGGTGNDAAFSVGVDSAGTVGVTGNFRDTMNPGAGSITSAGVDDIFVATYDAAGTPLLSAAYGSTGTDVGYSISLRNSVLALTGSFQGTVDFGSGPLTAAGNDVFVARYAY